MKSNAWKPKPGKRNLESLNRDLKLNIDFWTPKKHISKT